MNNKWVKPHVDYCFLYTGCFHVCIVAWTSLFCFLSWYITKFTHLPSNVCLGIKYPQNNLCLPLGYLLFTPILGLKHFWPRALISRSGLKFIFCLVNREFSFPKYCIHSVHSQKRRHRPHVGASNRLGGRIWGPPSPPKSRSSLSNIRVNSIYQVTASEVAEAGLTHGLKPAPSWIEAACKVSTT